MEELYADRGQGNSGLWSVYSPRCKKDFQLRSDLEYLHFLMVESDPAIRSVDYAPKSYVTRVAGEDIASIVDAVLELNSGQVVWREVKSEASLARGADARAELQIMAQRRNSAVFGARHEVLTELQLFASPMRLCNWHQAIPWIAQVRDFPLESQVAQIDAELNAQGPMRFKDLLDLGAPDRAALYGAAVLSGIQTGAFSSDLNTEPFCGHTLIFHAAEISA
ncbi:hypothetical protein QTI17_29275 [Variovorax sp. J31P179]|uniref:hypothetical protein n=1 Tax=Variovorax sp. J31P179 TaxID=3053508 RepID=UPI0025779A50|nr:hypothetical protein [Variovorax sp. J31P179]MDM0084699.1 hypothetical protein [Variovorax sp. J31P179]